jgi:hypothetical protein
MMQKRLQRLHGSELVFPENKYVLTCKFSRSTGTSNSWLQGIVPGRSSLDLSMDPKPVLQFMYQDAHPRSVVLSPYVSAVFSAVATIHPS